MQALLNNFNHSHQLADHNQTLIKHNQSQAKHNHTQFNHNHTRTLTLPQKASEQTNKHIPDTRNSWHLC